MATIKERAKDFAEKNYWCEKRAIGKYIAAPDSFIIAMYAYECDQKDFLKLPLSERLTEEEKDKIRKEWNDARKIGWYMRPYSRGRFRMLQDIFGTDFFQKEVTNDNRRTH